MRVATGGSGKDEVEWSAEFNSYSAFEWEPPKEYKLDWQPPKSPRKDEEEDEDE